MSGGRGLRLVAPVVCTVSAALGAADATATEQSSLPRQNCLVSITERPTQLTGQLDPGVVARFAILRRPAGPADRPPSLASFGNTIDFQLGRFYSAYIRRAVPRGVARSFYLIPGFARAQPVPPTRCLPRAQRRRRPALVRTERRRAKQLVYCLSSVDAASDVNVGCRPFAGIEVGQGILAELLAQTPVVDLVPDGVARVRLTYRTGARITGSVSENVLSYLPPRRTVEKAVRAEQRLGVLLVLAIGKPSQPPSRRERRLQRIAERALLAATPTHVRWLNAAGRVVRSFRPRAVSS